MIQSRHVATNVRLLSLLTGDVGIGGVSVDQAYYRMLSKDSSMLLTARLRSFSLSRSRYGLLSDHIDLGEAMVDGADAVILFDNRKAKPEGHIGANSSAHHRGQTGHQKSALPHGDDADDRTS